MNPRIKELYKNVLASSENMRWNIEDAEKFAELIVQECMKLNSQELSISAIERLLPLYQKHFGVE